MNRSQSFIESSVLVAFLIAVVCFMNPFGFLMTSTVHMMILGVIVACYLLFLLFIWRERVSDEREQLHQYLAARAAFVAGGAVLLVALVVQTFAHTLDPWIPVSLASMVLAKHVARWYACRIH